MGSERGSEGRDYKVDELEEVKGLQPLDSSSLPCHRDRRYKKGASPMPASNFLEFSKSLSSKHRNFSKSLSSKHHNFSKSYFS